MDLQAYLDHTEPTLDPKTSLPGAAFNGPGYHSTIANGTWVHHTRESMDYCLALLMANDPMAAQRVPKIILQALDMQETNPTKATFGIWPWLFEETLDQMSPPDWNWADFMGVRIAQMLKCHAAQLPDDIIGPMRKALDHAAWSIFRRNMHAGYTNIAVMGAACAAAAGELLNEPRLLHYAQIRLQNVVDHVILHGSFVEYNSPTYTTVLLEECSRMFVICEDPLIRALSHELLGKAWQVIGEHYHPGTHQWAGPHARAYKQLLTPFIAKALSHGLGKRVPVHPLNNDDWAHTVVLVPTQPCPDDVLPLFTEEKLASPLTIQRQFVKRDYGSQIGTTWMNDIATLGSINYEDTWNQRRPVLAYWKSPADPAVSLRVRLLHDDYDFASGMIRTSQQENRLLCAWNLLTNRGDTHCGLDKPEKPVFTFNSLKIQWELVGQNVSIDAIDENRFEMIAGDYRAVIHVGKCVFNGKPVTWECGKMEHGVTLVATCYQGEPVKLDMREVGDLQLACAMELIPMTQIASDKPLVIEPVGDSGYQVTWNGLFITVPQRSEAYPG